MSVNEVITQFNNENPMDVVDAILNSSYNASIIIDTEFYEIVHQNKKALEMLGNQIGNSFEEAIQSNGLPCVNLAQLELTEFPIVKSVYEVFVTVRRYGSYQR